MPYFDLKVMRSYKMGGWSDERYHFYKGTPTEVSEQDASKFRMHKDIFVEVDVDGNPIVEASVAGNARTVKKFRDYDGMDSEDVLTNAFERAVQQRKEAPVDVSKLLDEVKADSIGFAVKPASEVMELAKTFNEKEEASQPPAQAAEDEEDDEHLYAAKHNVDIDAPVQDGTITSDMIARPVPKKKRH